MPTCCAGSKELSEVAQILKAVLFPAIKAPVRQAGAEATASVFFIGIPRMRLQMVAVLWASRKTRLNYLFFVGIRAQSSRRALLNA